MIVTQTNSYAAHKNKNLVMTIEELKCFLGILLLSGYVEVPRRRIYWQQSEDTHSRYIIKRLAHSTMIKVPNLYSTYIMVQNLYSTYIMVHFVFNLHHGSLCIQPTSWFTLYSTYIMVQICIQPWSWFKSVCNLQYVQFNNQPTVWFKSVFNLHHGSICI